jgi:ribokinase
MQITVRSFCSHRLRLSSPPTLYDAVVHSIVSVGGIAEDVVLRMRMLPSPGTCVTAATIYRGMGGKAANQAVAAARLGGDVALVGCVGEDEAGRSLVTSLAAEGVAVEHVARDGDTSTGTVILLRNEIGEKQVVVFPGANAALRPDAIDAAAPLLRAARVVLVQLEIPLSVVEQTIRLVRATAARLVLDASPVRAFPRDLLRGAIVKANAAEASALTGVDVRDLESAREAAVRLMATGAESVTLEAGRAGNLFASRSEEVFVPRHDVASVDETGAGDALVGAFAVAMVEGFALREAAMFASAAAALATRSAGAQTALPARAELERWLAARVDQ